VTYRKYRTARRGRRVLAFVALGSAAVVGVGAGARAQLEQVPETSVAVVAPDVVVGGVRLGGLTASEAEAALAASFARPVVLRHGRENWRFAPLTLGAEADARRAAMLAVVAAGGTDVPLPVTLNLKRLEAWAEEFALAFERRPASSRVVLRGLRPRVTRSQAGRTLDADELVEQVATALRAGERGPLDLSARTLRPRVTRADIGPVVVIRRGSNRLFLYRGMTPKGMRLARKFRVATGQPAYPTPLGSFAVVTKQRDPWWYPPDSDWAAGQQPVPPGPGNPLGTRWMGLSEPLIGIHGTPDAASIGYSASHGCIRMHVPEAEWLFERVEVGTRVFIVPA
jgi:lipoprotein-anchoring transpeptidase ErfK/SrfK